MLQTANVSALSTFTSISCFVSVRGGYPLSLATWWRLVVKILTFFFIVLVWFVVCYFMNGVSRLTVLCRSYVITVGWGVGGSLCPFSTRNLQQKQMRAEVLCDVCRLCKANSEKCRDGAAAYRFLSCGVVPRAALWLELLRGARSTRQQNRLDPVFPDRLTYSTVCRQVQLA